MGIKSRVRALFPFFPLFSERSSSTITPTKDSANFFECPVCYEYVLPPILQCSNGHLVCSDCRPKLEQCPTCRDSLGTIRNLGMEQLASNLLFPCKYEGCQITMRQDEWFFSATCLPSTRHGGTQIAKMRATTCLLSHRKPIFGQESQDRNPIFGIQSKFRFDNELKYLWSLCTSSYYVLHRRPA